MKLELRPIGVVRINMKDEDVRNSWKGVKGVLELFPEYEDGLDGIDGFSHLILLTYLNRLGDEERKVLKVKFRRLKRFGIGYEDMKEAGVFCTDSPVRPNPIALTIVRLLERRGRFLLVDGLDVFDGTPILDIKAYTHQRIVRSISVPKWFEAMEERVREKLGDLL